MKIKQIRVVYHPLHAEILKKLLEVSNTLNELWRKSDQSIKTPAPALS